MLAPSDDLDRQVLRQVPHVTIWKVDGAVRWYRTSPAGQHFNAAVVRDNRAEGLFEAFLVSSISEAWSGDLARHRTSGAVALPTLSSPVPIGGDLQWRYYYIPDSEDRRRTLDLVTHDLATFGGEWLQTETDRIQRDELVKAGLRWLDQYGDTLPTTLLDELDPMLPENQAAHGVRLPDREYWGRLWDFLWPLWTPSPVGGDQGQDVHRLVLDLLCHHALRTGTTSARLPFYLEPRLIRPRSGRDVVMDLELQLRARLDTGGMAQALGVVCGYPFYFRAKYDKWSFAVAIKPGVDPVDLWSTEADLGYFREEQFGPSEGSAASNMDFSTAESIIRNCSLKFREYIGQRTSR